MWPEHFHPPPLDSDTVHVWSVALDLEPEITDEVLRPFLSRDECVRADRFRFARHRARFTTARAALRRLLGAYLSEPPEQIRFRYEPRGKPALDRPDASLAFNLSHAGGRALIAVVRGREVGVDLEPLRDGVEFEAIARSFFAPEETAVLLELPEDERPRGFFNCWTRKEAFIKARGDGLSLPLNRFTVTLRPDEPAALLTTQWNPAEAAEWSLHALDLEPGFVGALAVKGTAPCLRCATWPAMP